MKNYFLKLIPLIFALLCISCKEEVGKDAVVFHNFSPQSVIEIKAYSEKVNGVFNSNDCVYAYTGIIKSYHYHVISGLPKESYYLEVMTEDGEVYNGGSFSHHGIIYDMIVFSVDYELLDY